MLKKITYTVADKASASKEAYFWASDTTRIDEWILPVLLGFFLCDHVFPVLGVTLNNDAFWLALLMPVAFMARRVARKGGAK